MNRGYITFRCVEDSVGEMFLGVPPQVLRSTSDGSTVMLASPDAAVFLLPSPIADETGKMAGPVFDVTPENAVENLNLLSVSHTVLSMTLNF